LALRWIVTKPAGQMMGHFRCAEQPDWLFQQARREKD